MKLNNLQIVFYYFSPFNGVPYLFVQLQNQNTEQLFVPILFCYVPFICLRSIAFAYCQVPFYFLIKTFPGGDLVQF